ncbi:hypothetical protein ABIA26_002591 [Sinorhizobium fredii]
MRSIRKNSLLAGLAVVALMATSPVSAETLKFKADLKASSEVPPNDSAGQGTGDITLDTATKKLTWTVTSSGLSGEATAAHFHAPGGSGRKCRSGGRYLQSHSFRICRNHRPATGGFAVRKMVSQHPHAKVPRWRDPRAGGKSTIEFTTPALRCLGARNDSAPKATGGGVRRETNPCSLAS